MQTDNQLLTDLARVRAQHVKAIERAIEDSLVYGEGFLKIDHDGNVSRVSIIDMLDNQHKDGVE